MQAKTGIRFSITFFSLFIALVVHAQDSALINYYKRVDLLLNKIEAKTIGTEERKDLKTIAFDLQNRGQMLDESKHDYKGSLEFVSQAITIFKFLEDTLSVANNLKFRGYLLGRFGKFDDAKKEIRQAVDLFHSKEKEWGVAVSNFDMSRVYEFENKLDSAIYYCTLSLNYWKLKNTNSRVFNNQNLLINLLSKEGQLSIAKLVQSESERLSKDAELHWQDMIDFYFVSAKLYKATKEVAVSNRYQKLYDDKVTALKVEGINARSYFDSRL